MIVFLCFYFHVISVTNGWFLYQNNVCSPQFLDYVSWLNPVPHISSQLDIFKYEKRPFSFAWNFSLALYEVRYLLDPFQGGWQDFEPKLPGQLTRFFCFRIYLSLSCEEGACRMTGEFSCRILILIFLMYQITSVDSTRSSKTSVRWVFLSSKGALWLCVKLQSRT